MTTHEKADKFEATVHENARGVRTVNVPMPLVRQTINVPSTHAGLALHQKAVKKGEEGETAEPQFVEGFNPKKHSASAEAVEIEVDEAPHRPAAKRGARR